MDALEAARKVIEAHGTPYFAICALNNAEVIARALLASTRDAAREAEIRRKVLEEAAQALDADAKAAAVLGADYFDSGAKGAADKCAARFSTLAQAAKTIRALARQQAGTP